VLWIAAVAAVKKQAYGYSEPKIAFVRGYGKVTMTKADLVENPKYGMLKSISGK
jgi:hypothetical protein